MTSSDHTITQLLIVLATSSVVGLIFHRLKIPTILSFLFTGLIIGPYALGWVSSAPGAEAIAEIALSLLLFTIGLEFNLSRLKVLRNLLIKQGMPQVFGSILVFFLLVYWFFDFPANKALFLAFMLTLSSTAIVLKLLEDARDLNSPYGQNAVGILIFQDLAVILMILVVPFLSQTGLPDLGKAIEAPNLLRWTGQIGGLLLFYFLLGKYVLPRFLYQVLQTRSRELFFFTLLFICLGSGFLMHWVGASFSLGTFFAGVLIAESPYEKQAHTDFAPLRDNFLGFFFVSIGMLLKPAFFVENIHWLLLFLLLLMLVKISVIYVIVRLNRFPRTMSAMSALILFQVGEFSFVLANEGLKLGLLSQNELQMFLSLSILTLILTPFAYKYGPRVTFEERFTQWIPQPVKTFSDQFWRVAGRSPTMEISRQAAVVQEQEEHTIIIGFGVAGQRIAATLKSLEIPYVIVETNPETVKKFKGKGENIIFGDATRQNILREIGLERARMVVVTASGVRILDSMIDSIRVVNSEIPVIVRTPYIRDVDTIGAQKKIDWVVGEIETTMEVLARVFKEYGVPSQELHRLLIESRAVIFKDRSDWGDSLRRALELPTWEALSSICPYRVHEKDFGVGKTLDELHIRERCKVGVVVIYREAKGTLLPRADFELQASDILYLLGEKDRLPSAFRFLKTGE